MSRPAETITVAIEDIIMPKRLVITGNGKRYIATKGSGEYSDCYATIGKVLAKMNTASPKPATVDRAQWSAALKSKSILLDFGSVYSTDLLASINLLLPGSAVKDVVLTPGDAVISKPLMYVKDYLTGDIYKLTIDTPDTDIINIIQTYISGENVINMPFAFELGFDKTKPVSEGNLAQNILLDSNIIIGLIPEKIPMIQTHTPQPVANIAQSEHVLDSILKLFDLNRNATKRYIEKNDALVFIDKRATLKIFPGGLIEYTAENGGIDLYADSGDNKNAVPGSISNIYSLVRNVMRVCSVTEPQLQISSDLFGLTKQNFNATINIDYFINGRPAMILNDNVPEHPISIKVVDGKIVSYKQYISIFTPTDTALTSSPMLKAVDNLYLKLANMGNEIIVSDIYTAYVSDARGGVQIAWCAKIKDLDKIIIIDTN